MVSADFLTGVIYLMCIIPLAYDFVDLLRSGTRSLKRLMQLMAMGLCIGSSAVAMINSFLLANNGIAVIPSFFLIRLFDVLQVAACFYWFCYSETILRTGYIRKRMIRMLLLLPVAVLALIDLSAPLYYANEGAFRASRLWIPKIVIIWSYITFSGIKAAIRVHLRKDYARRDAYRPLVLFMLIAIVAQVLQLRLKGSVPVMSIAVTFNMLLARRMELQSRISGDELTGLNNRTRFLVFLSDKIKSHKSPLYLMVMDIDRFKSINDTYGHGEGDRALKQVAAVLKHCMPAGFCLARIGGDEFVAAGEMDSPTEMNELIAAIRSNLSAANDENKRPWNVSLSIGCVCHTPEMADIPTFFDAADAAMYREKRARKHGA
ncbi:MAG: GGDEF domain-containing protein [Clostridia bacterium]|nr:GGDEF domain-containing protein [Clostridia bacterium]